MNYCFYISQGIVQWDRKTSRHRNFELPSLYVITKNIHPSSSCSLRITFPISSIRSCIHNSLNISRKEASIWWRKPFKCLNCFRKVSSLQLKIQGMEWRQILGLHPGKSHIRGQSRVSRKPPPAILDKKRRPVGEQNKMQYKARLLR